MGAETDLPFDLAGGRDPEPADAAVAAELVEKTLHGLEPRRRGFPIAAGGLHGDGNCRIISAQCWDGVRWAPLSRLRYGTQAPEVALKIPNTEAGTDRKVWNRLFSEARVVARIQHRNVCPVFDVGQSHGRYYFAMAPVQGESLAARLQRGCLDCRQAATLAWKLAGALAVVHAAGIIHRDVKPQNVMLDAEGEPLLTDFGLARPVQIQSGTADAASLSGTPAYMAPEQVRGEPLTAASDIYALGLVLYQMLTGRLPFHGPLPQLASKILYDNPTRPSAFRSKIDPYWSRSA